jgi:predicted Zn-ribbon and HTH transcriptional regulator
MPTLRKEIAAAIEEESLDLREISQLFRIREREVLDHLQHISRSAHPKRLMMKPAQCQRCGFVFKKRGRLSAPSRCPLCKSESISPPRYQIIGGGRPPKRDLS